LAVCYKITDFSAREWSGVFCPSTYCNLKP
jgi:hypothetical protein